MNICIFGDSIVWGGYDPVNGGWANRLRNYLEGKYDEEGKYSEVSTYNLGICADDSTGLLKRFRVEAIPRKPDVIILAIGINDIRHQPDQPILFDKFENNIRDLVSQAIEFTNKIVILGITPVDEKLMTPRNVPPYNFRENKDIIKCNEILKVVAEKQKIIFIPIPRDFSVEDLSDGLHPNTKGHLKIFEAVKPVLEKFLKN
jgi:lysophospholipase L1-like esterase